MKAAVEQLRESFAFSERHACQLMGLAVSTFRYRKRCEDGMLREQLVSLTREATLRLSALARAVAP